MHHEAATYPLRHPRSIIRLNLDTRSSRFNIYPYHSLCRVPHGESFAFIRGDNFEPSTETPACSRRSSIICMISLSSAIEGTQTSVKRLRSAGESYFFPKSLPVHGGHYAKVCMGHNVLNRAAALFCQDKQPPRLEHVIQPLKHGVLFIHG